MKSIKQVGFKLIVTMCVVLTFCSFLASTPVYASKVSSDFYYSGTTKGSYTIEKGLLSRIIASFGAILDYILGLATMGFRIVLIGWTALLERCLTWILQAATDPDTDLHMNSVSSTAITESGDFITIDAIFFNRVPLLNVNFFDMTLDHEHTPTGEEIETDPSATPEPVDQEKDDQSLVMILKYAIAGWYYTFRALSFMVMLVILVYIGIKLAISSATKEKALYKRVLTDWVVGMILVFSIHYIMLFMIMFNQMIIDTLSNLRTGAEGLEVYEYGLIERAEQPVENDELEVNLYDEVKTRAYDAKLSVGTTGMIMYMVLVYYAWKYTFIYLKRYLTIAVLTMIAPIVAATYAFNKVNTGKSATFSKWFKEYLFTVLIQAIHAILYVVFLDTALAISLNSVAGIILVFALMNMISKAEGLFRRIFGITGSLTDEVSAGGGLREAFNDLKGIATGMAGGKVAKAYMGASTRILTKPIKVLGSATVGKGFSSAMAHKAKKLDKENQDKSKRAEKAKGEQEELEKIKAASVGHRIKTGEIDVSALEKAVNDLRVGQRILGNDGEVVGTVDEDYIKSEKDNLSYLKSVKMAMDDGTDLDAEYMKMTSKRALTKKYVSAKWKEIMDPYQYVEKNEKGKYKAIKSRERDGEYSTALGKALYGGKIKDSTSKRLLNNLKPSNLANLNDEERANLKSQTELAKKGITGFFGTLAGLPLLVAEPQFGAMLLYKGVSNLRESSNYSGRQKNKAIKQYANSGKADAKTRYILTGFEGNSKQVIAEQAKAEAREQIQELEESRAEKDRATVQNVERKHPKLATALKVSGITAGVAAGVAGATSVSVKTIKTLGTSNVLTAAVGTVAIHDMYARVGNVGSNLWCNFQSIARASRKHNLKAFEKRMKEGYSEAYMDKMANAYTALELDQHEAYISDHEEKLEDVAKGFGVAYTAYLASQREAIDQMSDEELQVENGFEEPIEVTEVKSGTIHKKQLTGESERNLIDNCIMRTAQKSGIIDLSEFELSSTNIQDVAKQMSDDLKKRGIIKNDESISTVIEDVEKKIKDRAAELATKGSKPIEEKLTDEAIVEVMQKGDKKGRIITDPSKVDSEAVQEVYQRKRDSITGARPTEESASVLSSIQKAKTTATGTTTETPTLLRTKTNSTEVAKTIEARKAKLADRAKKPLDKKASDEMKTQLKKKMEVALDTALIQNQAMLEEQATTAPNKKGKQSTGIDNLNGILANEAGGLGVMGDGSREVTEAVDSAKKTDSVLKMLELQTKMHKEKATLDSFVSKTAEADREKRRSMYISDLFSDEKTSSTARVSQTRDGSRKVTATSQNERLANKSIDELLKTLKSNM